MSHSPRSFATRHHAAVLAALAASLTVALSLPAAAQNDAATAKFESIQWINGPATGRLGAVAQLEVPAACQFTETAGAKAFLEAAENIPTGDEVGLLLCEEQGAEDRHWWVVYTYDASGYVRDNEKGSLDADAILASIRRGTEASNPERRTRGWDELTIDGWVRAPFYDERTHNLTWSVQALTSDGDSSANHSVRLLGRGGVLHADLVVEPSQLATVVPEFDAVVARTSFVPGSRYAEWREGDKVAAYGLTALVAGGAASKLGLFGKAGKLIVALGAALWKLIAVAVLGIASLAKSLMGRKDAEPEPASPARL